ncbi:hypothetical protein CH373_16905 [Leptospira perolatii]|uniref:DUF1554 domain-containing protein n=1 Tax=Leptospira perolatii TaxID=2023191 RepID=A0A2M9ZIR8_9LEPT|nr:DUF1554 domain-containing protein [Leptospira perolatii]PJZ68460.1 hypothetical protein CH360_16095 [Leptospira perolatii]PJZ71912.1 hypothetical protein CH373_16905 [Leptospira perolatii]
MKLSHKKTDVSGLGNLLFLHNISKFLSIGIFFSTKKKELRRRNVSSGGFLGSLKLFILTLIVVSCSKPFPSGDEAILLLNPNFLGAIADPALSYKYIFVTVTPRTGGLSGVAGADGICATEKDTNFATYPGIGTDYQALVVGTGRVACTTAFCSGGSAENSGWPLLPSTAYYLNYPAPVRVFLTGTHGIPGTTPGVSGFPLDQPFSSNGALQWWTGLAADWTSSPGEDCSTWGDGTGGSFGQLGTGGFTNDQAINSTFSSACNTSPVQLLCVRK